MHSLVKLAKDAIEKYVRDGQVAKPVELTSEMKRKAGVFVSLKIGGTLRGCIGTFEPTRENVAEEIVANAILSATQDPRFPPVSPRELELLEYSVDVLSHPEPVESVEQIDPKKYGVIVESGWKRGLLLPDIEGVDTAEQQIEICKQKAAISPDENIRLYRFVVKRYR